MQLPTHYDMPPTFRLVAEPKPRTSTEVLVHWMHLLRQNIETWGRVGWVKNLKDSEPFQLLTPCAMEQST